MKQIRPIRGRLKSKSQKPPTPLDIMSLSQDYRPGITDAIGNYLIEAISVCLDSEKHGNKVVLSVNGDRKFEGRYELEYAMVTDQMRRGHNDPEVATENGAYGISILLVDVNTEFTVIERSRKGTGFDYWLGFKDSHAPYFQNKARLEVSGIRHGNDSLVNSRMNTKLKQTERSDGTLPAFISVVEFGTPKAKVVKK